MYRALTVSYAPKAKKMALQIEEKANEMEKKGFLLVSVTATGSAKAVLVFHKPDSDADAQAE